MRSSTGELSINAAQVNLANNVRIGGALSLAGPPTEDNHAATKAFVEEQVAGTGGGVPVGGIIMWAGALAEVPAG